MTSRSTGGRRATGDVRSLGGEEALIQRYFAPLAAGYPGAFGLADDCAQIAPAPGCELVVTTDAVAAGVHFFPDDAPRDIGWKALAVNVSDLAAKGARPVAYVMAIALPEAPTDDWMSELAAGLGEAQRTFGCHLIGGDTDSRAGPPSITITALGEVPAGTMVRRGAARPGCDLYVTGTLGDAALGLMLRRDPGLARGWGLDEAEARQLVGRYLRPQPRLLGEVLRRHAVAAMDISDGLAKDLGRMARASGVGARVDAGALPLSTAARRALGRDAGLWERIVAGGDDYELLVAVAPAAGAAFATEAAAAGIPVTRIGHCLVGEGVAFDLDGTVMQLDRSGWDHF